MNSLGKTLVRSLCLAAAFGAGCTSVMTSEQRQVAAEPQQTIVFEGAATQPVRDYDQTSAAYQNGDIASGPTAFRYQSRDGIHQAAVPLAETGVFLANVVTAPVTAYEQRSGVVSTGPQIAPTHTAVPPLPASAAQIGQMSAPRTGPAEMAITTSPESAPTVVTTPTALAPAAELSTSAFAVVGHVQFPGRYEVAESLTLSQALVGAGLVETDGSNVTVKIERGGEEPSSALLSDILAGNTANPVLAPGDIVTVTVKAK